MAGNRSSSAAGFDPPLHLSGGAEAIQKVADLTIQGIKPEIVSITVEGLGAGLPDKVPVLLTPGENGGAIRGLKSEIEAYRHGPERRTGTASVTTLASFIDLTKRHADAHSVIFAKTAWPHPALTAVLDYHEKDHGKARYGTHRVHYAFPVTPEFQAWIDQVGKPMSQVEFAAFLEDHAAELTAPLDAEVSSFERLFKAKFATPNELIDLARSLEIAVGQSFKQAVRLQSGEAEIVFKEEHTDRTGQKITVPGIFMIALRAFVDGNEVRIPARLRYRAAGGTVTWFYDLYRWQDELRDRVTLDLGIAAEKTALPAYEGAPETGSR